MTCCPCGKTATFVTIKVVKDPKIFTTYKVPSYWCSVQCHNKGKKTEERL